MKDAKTRIAHIMVLSAFSCLIVCRLSVAAEDVAGVDFGLDVVEAGVVAVGED